MLTVGLLVHIERGSPLVRCMVACQPQNARVYRFPSIHHSFDMDMTCQADVLRLLIRP
jgi:hypothetical protein